MSTLAELRTWFSPYCARASGLPSANEYKRLLRRKCRRNVKKLLELFRSERLRERKKEQRTLFDVFHRQQCAIVAAGGIDGAGHHGGKGISHFGVLRHQRFDHGEISLIGLAGV